MTQSYPSGPGRGKVSGKEARSIPGEPVPTLFCSVVNLSSITQQAEKQERALIFLGFQTQRQIPNYKLVALCIVKDPNPLIFHFLPSSSCCHGDFFSLTYYSLLFRKKIIALGPSGLTWDVFHCSWCNTQR